MSMPCFPAPLATRARTRRGPCRIAYDRRLRWRCRRPARRQARRRPAGSTHQRDLGRIRFVLRRLDQRRHVGAAAGNENGDAFAAHGVTRDRVCRHRRRAARRGARSPGRCMTAFSPAAVKASATLAASFGAAIAIMPMPQLKVRSISLCAMPPSSRQPFEHRQHRHAAQDRCARQGPWAARAECCREIRRR